MVGGVGRNPLRIELFWTLYYRPSSIEFYLSLVFGFGPCSRILELEEMPIILGLKSRPTNKGFLTLDGASLECKASPLALHGVEGVNFLGRKSH